MKESTSEYMYKTSCEACGSSDARAVYSDGGSYCFVCSNTIRGDKDTFKQSGQVMKKKEFEPQFITYPNSIRGISKTTLEKFTYGVANGKHVTYYYNKDGDIVAEKYRSKDKKFGWSGSAKQAVLFGQNVFPASNKIKLILTEGELDAMSVSTLQGDRYPVVSLGNGAASARKDVKANHEYLSSFKELVIMLDEDEVGNQAAKEVLSMFPLGYAKIAKLPLKDANEMLKAGRGKELISAIFNAKALVPEEIVNDNKLLDLLNKVDTTKGYPFPKYLPNLSEKMRGMRIGDLTVIASGSGNGKTTLLKQLELHFYETTDFNSGIIHLEESIRNTMQGLVSVKLGRQLHLEEDSHKDQEVIDLWTKIATDKDDNGNNRINIVDSFGSLSTDKLYDMVRYMAQVEQCKVVYIDHLSMLVSGMDGNIDERRMLDNIMTTLKSLTQELDIHIFLISHLNNNTGNGPAHEEGGIMNVNQLRGSGGIKQLSDNIIGLTRNQMSECLKERNTTQISLLKCRLTGMTGKADKINYNSLTGIFSEVTEEYVVSEEDTF